MSRVCLIHQQVLFERMVYKTFFLLDLDKRIYLVFHVYWKTLKGSKNEWHWVYLNDLHLSKSLFYESILWLTVRFCIHIASLTCR